jgi:hypothetical protein
LAGRARLVADAITLSEVVNNAKAIAGGMRAVRALRECWRRTPDARATTDAGLPFGVRLVMRCYSALDVVGQHLGPDYVHGALVIKFGSPIATTWRPRRVLCTG